MRSLAHDNQDFVLQCVCFVPHNLVVLTLKQSSVLKKKKCGISHLWSLVTFKGSQNLLSLTVVAQFGTAC